VTTAPSDVGTSARTITVWQDQVRMRVRSKGSGPALVFLHGPWGLSWDPFLDELARHFTVHAPEHPGTTPDAPDDVYRLDGLWDLVLCYDELLNALSLDSAAVIGHSFGGMMACELAAANPRRVHRLAMIDPLGFWRDKDPVVNWMMLNPGDLPAHVFHRPDGDAAKRMFGAVGEQDPATRLRMTWAMGTTGKFIWPLPDKGLKKRIHRVTAPSLLIWGANDRLVPPVYAEEFMKRLPDARLEVVAHAGHAPHLEHPQTVATLVTDFLRA
jgi:pimeloyl-ACP methyl ester carboxylesterase